MQPARMKLQSRSPSALEGTVGPEERARSMDGRAIRYGSFGTLSVCHELTAQQRQHMRSIPNSEHHGTGQPASAISAW